MLSGSAWGPWRGKKRRWRCRRSKFLFLIFAFAFFVSLFALQMAALAGEGELGDVIGHQRKSESENALIRGLRFADIGPRKQETSNNRDILQADSKIHDTEDEIVGESDEMEEDYDEDNDNPVFREGDFDGLTAEELKPGSVEARLDSENNGIVNDLAYESENVDDYASWNAERKLQGQYDSNVEVQTAESLKNESETVINGVRAGRLIGKDGTIIVENGIFWSVEVGKRTPEGFDDHYVADFRARVRRLPIASSQPPSWDRCGRPKNQFITLADGTPMCARYRTPHDYLVQGEVMSFFLARLLGIQNVPIVVLSRADWNGPQWKRRKVRQQIKEAGWMPNATVALIQWIHNLERDRMPSLILNALRNHTTISVRTSELSTLSPEELSELLQWSDLIIFDYITGNYDRVASMQDAADKEEKPSILSETVHNLVKSKSTKGLWLIDNESGLLDAYSLLYSDTQPNQQGGRFIAFHRQVLQTMCIFRRSTHEKIQFLHHHGDAKKLLLDAVARDEPLFASLPDVRENEEFTQHFQERIADVYHQTRLCYDKATAVS